jgi:aminomethyltransferase
MALKTPLYDTHVALGARMVDFGGWDMPVNYGSQIDEHHAVRRDAGMFDVSHMCVVDLKGSGAGPFLRHLLANDVGRLTTPGKALYSCMLREDGGVIDDLIVYYMHPTWYRVVVNAGTRDKDLAWMRQHASAAEFAEDLEIIERKDVAMIAVQGPQAREKAATVLPSPCRDSALALETFYGVECGDFFVARTGYTGEDGFEIMLPATEAPAFWMQLQSAGIAPCGLGARDTLRLEAGMNLYGSDMDETRHPLESGLGWTLALKPEERLFIGRAALEKIKAAGNSNIFVGLILEERGVLRGHQKVVTPNGPGEVTSGTFSPTLERSIALARVPAGTTGEVQVDIRGKLLKARVVRPPFVRNGKACVTL